MHLDMSSVQTENEASYFEKERERMVAEITSNFEELLSSSNLLNRKLEEVLGVGKEFETIASLWGRFHELMQEQQDGDNVGNDVTATDISTSGGKGS